MHQAPLSHALDAPWALGRAAFEAIASHLDGLAPRQLVEFGSGVSTAALALRYPALRILSIDHDARFLDATRARLAEGAPGASAHVELALRPLVWQRHGGAPYLGYAPAPFPEQVDAVLIDGPPFWTRGGREAALYQVMPHLRVGGLVFLDDYGRAGERRMVRHWLSVYRGSLTLETVLEAGHRVAVLRRTDTLAPRWDAPRRHVAARLEAGLQPVAAAVRRFALALRQT
jgi:predicted O-methyltransferase YrrM